MFYVLQECYNTLMEDEQQWGSDEAEQNYGPEPTLTPVTWSASEFVSHQKTTLWYVGLGFVSAIVTLLVFLVTRNLLSGIVVAMACMALGVFAARTPQTKTFEINTEGVVVAGRPFPYGLFKSFSIMEDGGISCIWLRPIKKFMPTVVMYYGPEEEEQIILMLDNFLPQEDRQHDFVDKVSRRIRF